MRRLVLLLAGVAGAVPVVATPASAEWLFGGCAHAAFADRTDPLSETWIELTYSAFVGTPDVTRYRVTCWLQTEEDLAGTTTDDTEADYTDAASYTSPQPDGEIPNTRHTCTDAIAAGACANAVVFQTPANVHYECQHVTWTDGGLTGDPLDVLDHFVRDVGSTGGITTTAPSRLEPILLMAITNMIDTLQAAESRHTIWYDAKPLDDPDPDRRKDGIQCWESEV